MEKSMDLFTILYSLKKRWKMIVALCLLGIIIAGLYSFVLVTPMYSSQVKIFIYQNPSDSSTNTYQDIMTNNYLVNDYKELVNSAPIISRTLTALEAEGYSSADVESEITVTAVSNTRFIYITATNENPQYAAIYANELSKVFAEEAAKIMKLENVNIIEEAVAADAPVSPNKKLNMVIGLLVGFVLGIIIAIAIDMIDNKVRYTDDLKNIYTQYTILGAVPDIYDKKSGKNKERDLDEETLTGGEQFLEAFKSIRTNILFSGIDKECICLTITSSVPGEGKTTGAVNLAKAFAKDGRRTLIVDADLRRPRVHKHFKINTVKGLTSVLVADMEIPSSIVPDVMENLDVMPAGIRPPNPPELLGTNAMTRLINYLKGEYEVIIIDTPPAGMFTDAAILSRYSDGSIYFVASGKPTYNEVARGVDSLEKVNANMLGFVMTRVERTQRGESYYNYSYSSYYGKGLNNSK